MVAPERRTRVDVVAACAIAVVVLVAAGVIWLRSDARGTVSVTAEHPAAPAETALSVPETLTEAWRASSRETAFPLVAGGAVVTADDGTVLGRDPATGTELWRYQRDMPLCGAVDAWHTVVAVYRDRLGCGQVTQLDGSTGARQAQRNSDADESVTLSEDGTYLTSRGSSRLEVWRSDLVRTLEFGRVDAPVNPGAQPRSGCTLLSSASSSSRLAVLERCPGESADRISILNPAPKDNSKPEEYGSTLLDDAGKDVTGAAVLAVSGDRTAVYAPPGVGGGARIAVYDGSGSLVNQFPVSGDVSPTARVVRSGPIFAWWTGSRVISLRATDFTPGWTVDGALGPGTAMAGQFLVPVDGAVAVVDPTTGAEVRRVPVDRAGPTPATLGGAPITSAALGGVLLEQRGDDLVALR
ncbi:PQQ-binding-like beta-propeller repeat protein [Rhodococcus spelaei]|uniref:PQQ-binding-like beta-propeller repeat protein n=1 Tax=Rhodococcus spelaei TaxID=2546320 RepID=A0A541B186_9NOCA|nr:PQQ-binding-like beta-propeller repeat protein [Rhodococcus spelaei]TQF66088.1 PQQ-binding-like beta-propeller repeat protein [Rhodococcus spelaei]